MPSPNIFVQDEEGNAFDAIMMIHVGVKGAI
jgi:hypothetical protein